MTLYNTNDHSDAAQSLPMQVQCIAELTHRYRAILNTMPSGYVYCQVLYDKGIAVDLIIEEVNRSWEKHTGMKDIIGRKPSRFRGDLHQAGS